MIKRIVKLQFREEALPRFLNEVFEESKGAIRAYPGCQHMELVQDTREPNTLFTLSIWDNEAALNQYRESELFKKTWERTKALFAARAEAWSVQVLDAPAI